MTNQRDIIQTFEDYQNCVNGFEAAANWRSEIGRRSRV